MPVAGGSLTPLPQFSYLVAFNNNATDDVTAITSIASPGVLGGVNVWTDITQFVSEHTLKRGRQHELSQFESGALTLSLNNNDARFNPWNTSGPYYGHILPLKPIQVRVTYGTVTYYRFTGLVTAWPIHWDDPASGFAELQAKDAFYWLNQVDIGSSPVAANAYKNVVLSNSPKGYWRLGDLFSSTVAADSSGNGRNASVSGDVTFGGPQALFVDPTNSAVFGSGSGRLSVPSAAGITGTGPFTIEAWINTSSNDTSYRTIYSQRDPSGNIELFLGIRNGHLTFGYPLTGASPNITEDTNAITGGWYFVILQWDGVSLLQGFWSNGKTAGGVPSSPTPLSLTASTVSIASGAGTSGFVGDIQDVAVFGSTFSPFSHSNAALFPWLADRLDQRVGRVLDSVGWSAGARSLDTSSSQTLFAAINSSLLTTTGLSHMQRAEETEAGALFMDAQGRVKSIARQSLMTAPHTTSQVTLGDNPGELPWEPGPDLALDDLDIVNQETCQSATSSAAQMANDSTSQASYGIRSRSATGLLNIFDSDSLYHAQWDVGRLSQPIIRLRRIKINPLDDPINLYPAVLGRELLDRVTVNRHGVPGGGDAFTQTALVEGMEEKASASDGWELYWSLSPTDAQTVWTLGDAALGVLGSTTKLGW